MNELKEDNKKTTEVHKNYSKRLNEILRTMKDMKIESNTEKEMLKKFQSEMKQKKKQIEKLNRPYKKKSSVKASPTKWNMKTVYQRLKLW